MRILHPFMPFITEELWQGLREREESDLVIVADWPEAGKVDPEIIQGANVAYQVITNIRKIRQEKNIPFKDQFPIYLRAKDLNIYYPFAEIIRKLTNIESVNLTQDKIPGATGFLVGTDEWYVSLDLQLDHEKELEMVTSELEYVRGFLKSVMKKLDNERFVKNAPTHVVENEEKKKEDSERKIKTLEEKLEHLKEQM
jgi:valyl-tRNA synthetase